MNKVKGKRQARLWREGKRQKAKGKSSEDYLAEWSRVIAIGQHALDTFVERAFPTSPERTPFDSLGQRPRNRGRNPLSPEGAKYVGRQSLYLALTGLVCILWPLLPSATRRAIES